MPVREALAFDMYGTLVDTSAIKEQLAAFFPEQAAQLAQTWRQHQLEFSFRVTLMGQYKDFASVTRKALDYTLDASKLSLTPRQKDSLMAHYNALVPHADVKPGLERLQSAGFPMVIFSNGAPSMLHDLLDHSGLRPYFQDIISADEIKVYKPTPKLYQHAAQRLNRPLSETRLISANPFDVTGALNAGIRAALVNRSNLPLDPLGATPDVIVKTLTELADALTRA